VRIGLSIRNYNETVTHNPSYVVKNNRLRCIFGDPSELALRGCYMKSNSDNPGEFRELVNFSSELDDKSKVHLERSAMF